MSEVDNTSTILYRYLRELSVKVSRNTVQHLLDTPVGDSMRGISDALDALHIKNKVYQLPSHEYFSQLDAPFITMLQVDKSPFCVVTKKDDFIVEFSNIEGKKRNIGVDTFLKKWTGTVLFGEVTGNTPVDSSYLWKNIGYYLLKYKILIAILLVLALGFLTTFRQEYSLNRVFYLGTLCLGILTSIAILYKEQFNEHFLERICHLGQAVNCNKVLHSKGANIAGTSLGELSLLYFTVLFLFSAIQSQDFYGIAVICNVAAVCFTIYSIIYQSFIIRKGCILCMLVNLIIWSNAAILCITANGVIENFSIISTLTFAAIGCISLIIGIAFSIYRKEYKEKNLLRARQSTLLSSITFQKLLELQPSINGTIPPDLTINNHLSGKNHLLIITNPNCANCKQIHPYVKELASIVPISLILITHPGDKAGKQATEIILTAYLQKGWNKAMQMLEEWFNFHKIKEAGNYTITPQIEDLRRKQVAYCLEQKIDQTPLLITDGHYIPEVYSISDLRYVLT